MAESYVDMFPARICADIAGHLFRGAAALESGGSRHRFENKGFLRAEALDLQENYKTVTN